MLQDNRILKLFITTILFSFVNTEEILNFCIRTEPMLLQDINDGQTNNEVVATILTRKEKDSFVNTMCSDNVNLHRSDYEFFKLRNGTLEGRSSYREICDTKSNPLLAWIPYHAMQKNFAHLLNPKERIYYIAKATDMDQEKTQLCHFKHSDFVNNISDNLFTCILMIFEDNFYGLDNDINVLIEILPIKHELRNVTYLPGGKEKDTYKTILTRSETLTNPSKRAKEVHGVVSYTHIEKIHLNLSSIYSQTQDKLPLLFEHRGSLLELDEFGDGGVFVKDRALFSRLMDPKSTVKLDLIGQWRERQQEFNATIYDYFGGGIRRLRSQILNGVGEFMSIRDTEAVYEHPESSHLTKSSIFIPPHQNSSSACRIKTQPPPSQKRRVVGDNTVFEYNKHLKKGSQSTHSWLIVMAGFVFVVVLGTVYFCNKNEKMQKVSCTDNLM